MQYLSMIQSICPFVHDTVYLRRHAMPPKICYTGTNTHMQVTHTGRHVQNGLYSEVALAKNTDRDNGCTTTAVPSGGPGKN